MRTAGHFECHCVDIPPLNELAGGALQQDAPGDVTQLRELTPVKLGGIRERANVRVQ